MKAAKEEKEIKAAKEEKEIIVRWRYHLDEVICCNKMSRIQFNKSQYDKEWLPQTSC